MLFVQYLHTLSCICRSNMDLPIIIMNETCTLLDMYTDGFIVFGKYKLQN